MDPSIMMEQAALSHQHAMKMATAPGDSPIQKFYEDSVIFVTGGTGFLGKLVIEKLLRTCAPRKIYLLIRHKKEEAPKERLLEIFKDPLYEVLSKERPDFVDKISVIQGDTSEIRLGMSDDDWKTLSEEVHVVFHIAANVRFDVKIKTAILCNARGTREVLRLASDCKNLRALVYVSTAYTHATRDRIGHPVFEQFYENPAPPEAMIQLAESLSNEKLDAMTPTLICNWPNTYAFSKAISEGIVRELGANLPVCIIRPAIVTSTYREPCPGWLDISSAYGPSGIIIGAGLGILHINYADYNIKLDTVPADFVNNAIIAAAWETARRRDSSSQSTKIYTVSSSRNPISFGYMSQELQSIKERIAYSKAVWYSFAWGTKYKFLYTLLFWFVHYIPGYIVDGVLFLMRKPRMFVKLYEKVDKLSISLGYFTTNDWIFKDDNLQKLHQSLSPTDRQIFNFDITTLDWKEKLCIWALGAKIYLLKDKLSNTYALKKQFVLRIVHYLVSVLYLYVLWKLFKCCFDLFISCLCGLI